MASVLDTNAHHVMGVSSMASVLDMNAHQGVGGEQYGVCVRHRGERLSSDA